MQPFFFYFCLKPLAPEYGNIVHQGPCRKCGIFAKIALVDPDKIRSGKD
jgi:hypothetical protein